jgi:hypothetical protein
METATTYVTVEAVCVRWFLLFMLLSAFARVMLQESDALAPIIIKVAGRVAAAGRVLLQRVSRN